MCCAFSVCLPSRPLDHLMAVALSFDAVRFKFVHCYCSAITTSIFFLDIS